MDRQSERVAEFTRHRNNRNKLYRLIAVMGLLVVAFTAFMLIRPAITMEGQAKILNCQYTVHQHDDSCYKKNADGEKELVCGKADYVIHEHEESCYDSSGRLICPLNAVSPEEAELHTHTEDCYDESGDLICDKLEVLAHTHGDECFETADNTQTASEEFTLTAKTDSGITVTVTGPADALPYPADEITVTVEEITDEESEDIRDKALKEDNLKAAENYLFDVCLWHDGEEIEPTSELTLSFSGLPLENGNKTVVYHIDKEKQDAVNMDAVTDDKDNVVLDTDHFSTYSVSLLAASRNNSVAVYQVNKYSQSVTTIAYGGSVRDKFNSMAFKYWDAIVVEKNSNGGLYVKKYVTEDVEKYDCVAETSDGFILLLYNTSVNAAVGDSVNVSQDFDYKSAYGYNANGYGTVTFGSSAAQKPDKDNSGELTVVPGADTRDLIEVNLYDYNDRVNDKYNSNKTYPGFQQDKGQLNVGNTYDSNFGNNITSDLDAGQSGVTVANGDNINATEGNQAGGPGLANTYIHGKMQTNLSEDGYPVLANGNKLDYLWSNSECASKQNSESINGLFQYNSKTGAYTFNSRENHAQFDRENNKFTLYSQIISSNFIWYPFGNFLPFNDIVHQSAQVSTIDKDYMQVIANSALSKYNKNQGDKYRILSDSLNTWIGKMNEKYSSGWGAAQAMNEYFNNNPYGPGKKANMEFNFPDNPEINLDNIYSIDFDEPTDFYFGMEMKMHFMQPKDGLTGKDTNEDGIPDYPMVYEFSGDDDVLVYIDGKLVLDLSGIHRHVGGKVDFTEGKVYYQDLNVKTGDVGDYKDGPTFAELGLETDSKGKLIDYSTHSFNFYYMERGAGSGVCRMNFNFPLLKKNTISVMKEVSVDEGNIDNLLGDPDYKFQILKENGELFFGKDVEYEIYNTRNEKKGDGKTGENGIFTLKANEIARFSVNENQGKYSVRELLDTDIFEQYGTISVVGQTETVRNDVTIDEDQFVGVQSPVKDISDGDTIFRFNNQVAVNKTGSLKITKVLNSLNSTNNQKFRFKVLLDGSPIPSGTKFTVGNEIRTVEYDNSDAEKGIIELSKDETAVISNIVAGTAFEVEELDSDGYTVTYAVKEEGSKNIITSGEKASGTIKVNSAVDVKITNSDSDHAKSVNIPIEKILSDSDNELHTFRFSLVEVTDATGNTQKTDGVKQNIPLTIDKYTNPALGSFTLTYFEKDYIKGESKQHFYKITETESQDQNDNNALVMYDQTEYIVEVNVTRATDGSLTVKAIEKGEDLGNNHKLVFKNTQLYSLTIAKTVSGTSESIDDSFDFTAEFRGEDNNILTGEYNAVVFKPEGSNEDKIIELKADKDEKTKFSLKNGEKLTIYGLPKGATCTVSEDEDSSSGYIVKYKIGSDTKEGREASITLEPDNANNIEFINEAAYALPETGGMGTLPFTIAGIILIFGAGAILYRTRLRRRED